MQRVTGADDDELLNAASYGDGQAFAFFYERHLATVLAFVRRRVGSAEAAADVTAETFAAALISCGRYRPGGAPAVVWLLGIARNKTNDALRRHGRDTRARERLRIREIPFTEDDLAAVEALAAEGSRVLAELNQLPAEQREAVWRRVVRDQDYPALAEQLDCSPALARQRVSRGLRRLRARLQEDR